MQILVKTDANFNYVAVKEEKAPAPKKVQVRQNTNMEKHPQENQIRLPKLKDGKSTRELESGNSFCFTFINIVDLCNKYLPVSCGICFETFYWIYVFVIFFSFLFRHFTEFDETILKLSFYKHSIFLGFLAHWLYWILW